MSQAPSDRQRPLRSIFGAAPSPSPGAASSSSERAHEHDDHREQLEKHDYAHGLDGSESESNFQPAQSRIPDVSSDLGFIHSSDDDEDVDEDDDEAGPLRPHFSGPPRAYRHAIAEEIAVVNALEQIDGDDLAAHLYNVHAIKASLVTDEARARRPPAGVSKQAWRQEGQWAPPASWTAWPLPPDQVPWATEGFAGPVVLGSREWWPARDLGELYVLGALRDANKCLAEMLAKHEDVDTLREESEDVEMEEDEGADEEEEEDEEAEETVDGADIPPSNASSPHEQQPLPLADDGEAFELLHPLMHRTLGKLDELLDGLHRARQNRQGGLSSSEESESEQSSDGSRKRKRARSLGAGPRKRATSVEAGRRPQRITTRDWSEVLGNAALAGWDESVIERAAERCETLFNERMEFVTYAPQDPNDASTSIKAESPGPRSRQQTPMSASGAQLAPTQREKGWYCPDPTCERHSRPWANKRGIREHCSQRHASTVMEMLSEHPGLDDGAMSCPREGCEFRCRVFPDVRRLNEHIKRTHDDLDESEGVASATHSPASRSPTQRPARTTLHVARDLVECEYLQMVDAPDDDWL